MSEYDKRIIENAVNAETLPVEAAKKKLADTPYTITEENGQYRVQ